MEERGKLVVSHGCRLLRLRRLEANLNNGAKIDNLNDLISTSGLTLKCPVR